MSLLGAPDVPLLISSPNASSERRISPSWTIAHLKSRLEPITGVPAGSQQLTLRVASQDAVPITAPDEEQTTLAVFPLQPYAQITVRPFPFSFLARPQKPYPYPHPHPHPHPHPYPYPWPVHVAALSPPATCVQPWATTLLPSPIQCLASLLIHLIRHMAGFRGCRLCQSCKATPHCQNRPHGSMAVMILLLDASSPSLFQCRTVLRRRV